MTRGDFMLVQVFREKNEEKLKLAGTKDCNNEFVLLSAISLLVYFSKKENMDVDAVIDKCHSKLLEMKVKNL